MGIFIETTSSKISGQVVYLASGFNTVDASVDISGTIVHAEISGQTVYLTSGQNEVQVVGTVPVTTSISGNQVNTSISGNIVGLQSNPISGQTVISQVSGQNIGIIQASGRNGVFLTNIGQTTTVAINPLSIEGYTTSNPSLHVIAAGFGYDSASDRLQKIRSTESGSPAAGGGTDFRLKVSLWSGDFNAISGKTVNTQRVSHSILRTRPVLAVTADSGGAALLSGDVSALTLEMLQDEAGVIYVGSETDPPFSGKGLVVYPGAAYNVEMDNFNRVRVVATTSGAKVSYIGVQY